MEHEPVLPDRVLEFLVPALHGGGVFLDATLGRAGHARLVLDAAPAAQLVGIDRDPASLEESRAHLAPFEGRVRLVRDGFENLQAILERLGDAPLRGVLFDLGVSSPQLDEADRGFGFRSSGPLDMRMDPSQPLSANDVVNKYGERDLERVISRYGEERFARRIARSDRGVSSDRFDHRARRDREERDPGRHAPHGWTPRPANLPGPSHRGERRARRARARPSPRGRCTGDRWPSGRDLVSLARRPHRQTNLRRCCKRMRLPTRLPGLYLRRESERARSDPPPCRARSRRSRPQSSGPVGQATSR